jgi:DNA-binding XRE family transcriptional regulator
MLIGKTIGVTRQSMMLIETRKRPLQWSNYLALVLVFNHYEDTKMLMESLELVDLDVVNRQ